MKHHSGNYRATVNGEEIARREFDGNWRRMTEARTALLASLDDIEELH
ncbi:MAG: hypothetical protein HYR85_08150 [Planctomycetes bacterium]|nr:hypothetical protein [Planctomycetota bacterium]MBI3843241.1 hypothetical protein [Planctomycetota bacterium]